MLTTFAAFALTALTSTAAADEISRQGIAAYLSKSVVETTFTYTEPDASNTGMEYMENQGTHVMAERTGTNEVLMGKVAYGVSPDGDWNLFGAELESVQMMIVVTDHAGVERAVALVEDDEPSAVDGDFTSEGEVFFLYAEWNWNLYNPREVQIVVTATDSDGVQHEAASDLLSGGTFGSSWALTSIDEVLSLDAVFPQK